MTLGELERAFAAGRAAGVPRHGDADLNPGMRPDPTTPAEILTAAAVLVPILRRPQGETVLFTVRHRMLKRHAGQISFPGGRTDPDEDPVATALREAHEEVGLPPAAVRVLGSLDCYVTRTGFCVTPVVGVIDAPPALVPADDEVEAMFEAPLDYVLDPRNVRRDSLEVGGRPRQFYVIEFGEHLIWGATAGMLVHFAAFLRLGAR